MRSLARPSRFWFMGDRCTYLLEQRGFDVRSVRAVLMRTRSNSARSRRSQARSARADVGSAAFRCGDAVQAREEHLEGRRRRRFEYRAHCPTAESLSDRPSRRCSTRLTAAAGHRSRVAMGDQPARAFTEARRSSPVVEVLRRRAGDGRRRALRAARLGLVATLAGLILRLADISEIVTESGVGEQATDGEEGNEEDQASARKARRARRRAAAEGRRSRQRQKRGKYVYLFGKKTDGNGTMKPLLGGKGANLAEMCRIGLPVPPGFTITTEVCTYYYEHKRTYPPALQAQMKAGVAAIEKQTEKKFGDLKNPLLVSVRSGARDSMPGMMDTILNLGLNDQTVEALATKTEQPALCLGLLSPLRPDVRRRRAGRAEATGRGSRAVRDGHRDAQARALSRGHRGHEAHGRGSAGAGRALQGAREGARRQEFPDLAVGSADGRRRRRVRLVDERPRHRLSPQVQHPDRVGHRRQRAGDGVRQHRRQLRVGRGVHAQSRPTATRSSTASS